MDEAVKGAFDCKLDEMADLMFYGFAYQESDLEDLNQFAAEIGLKLVTEEQRARFARLYQEAKKPPLGSGERFKAMVKSGISPALAATIGRKKFGKEKMAQLSAKGQKRAAKRKKKAA